MRDDEGGDGLRVSEAGPTVPSGEAAEPPRRGPSRWKPTVEVRLEDGVTEPLARVQGGIAEMARLLEAERGAVRCPPPGSPDLELLEADPSSWRTFDELARFTQEDFERLHARVLATWGPEQYREAHGDACGGAVEGGTCECWDRLRGSHSAALAQGGGA